MSIQILNDIDSVRQNPDLWAGSLDYPDHLCLEVLDNAIDQFPKATFINITLTDDGVCIIEDDGEGIPLNSILNPKSGIIEEVPVILATSLFSSGKFNNLEEKKTTSGKHGVGLVVVNALSDYLTIQINSKNNEDNINTYNFVNSIFSGKSIESKYVNWSTRIEFKVNSKFVSNKNFNFGTNINDSLYESLKHYLGLINSKYPKVRIKLNDELIHSQSNISFIKNWFKYDVNNCTKITNASFNDGGEHIQIYYWWDYNNKESVIFGDCNRKLCSGRYITDFTSRLTKIINSNGFSFKKEELMEGFKCYISLNLYEPKFNGQLKSKLTNNCQTLFKKITSQIENSINQYTEFLVLLPKKKLKDIQLESIRKSIKLSANNPVKHCIDEIGNTLYFIDKTSNVKSLIKTIDIKSNGIFPLLLNDNNSEQKSLILEAIGKFYNKEYKYLNIKIILENYSKSIINTINLLKLINDVHPDLILDDKVSLLVTDPDILLGSLEFEEFKNIFRNLKEYHVKDGNSEIEPEANKEYSLIDSLFLEDFTNEPKNKLLVLNNAKYNYKTFYNN